MPEVSETKADTSQVVKEPPSEPVEGQVAPPEPSLGAEPVQEPEKPPEETPEQQKQRVRKEALESEEGKAAIQSEADKRALKLRQEYDARQREESTRIQRDADLRQAKEKRERNQAIYRQLQVMEQQKPDEWRQHMRDPQYAAIWNEGLNTTLSTAELDVAKGEGRSEGGRAMLDQVAQRISSRPEMESLTQEELTSLDSGKFAQSLDGYVDQIVVAAQMLGKRAAAKEFAKEKDAFEETARKDEREKLQAKYREAGIGPEEIEGKGAPGALTKEKYAAMTADERSKLSEAEIDAMVKRETGV